jgi:hypothetical protein
VAEVVKVQIDRPERFARGRAELPVHSSDYQRR